MRPTVGVFGGQGPAGRGGRRRAPPQVSDGLGPVCVLGVLVQGFGGAIESPLAPSARQVSAPRRTPVRRVTSGACGSGTPQASRTLCSRKGAGRAGPRADQRPADLA